MSGHFVVEPLPDPACYDPVVRPPGDREETTQSALMTLSSLPRTPRHATSCHATPRHATAVMLERGDVARRLGLVVCAALVELGMLLGNHYTRHVVEDVAL